MRRTHYTPTGLGKAQIWGPLPPNENQTMFKGTIKIFHQRSIHLAEAWSTYWYLKHQNSKYSSGDKKPQPHRSDINVWCNRMVNACLIKIFWLNTKIQKKYKNTKNIKIQKYDEDGTECTVCWETRRQFVKWVKTINTC